jgi:transposase-like protein
VLHPRATGQTTSVRDARRAKIILLATYSVASRRISKTVGMLESNVAKWRKRFCEHRPEGW